MALKKKIAVIVMLLSVTVMCCWVLAACNSQVKVTFDTQGGSAVLSQSPNKGGTASLPEEPTRSGYEFDGWYVDRDLSAEFDFQTALTEDIVLYAKWLRKYNVVYNTMGGSSIESDTVKEGELLLPPQTPLRTGYNFSGWYTDMSCNEAYGFSNPVTEDMTLYAGWSQKTYYSVQFFVGKYDENSSWQPYGDVIWAEAGSQISFPDDPNPIVIGGIHKQWTFAGWDKTIDCVLENTKLYATYVYEDEATRYVMGGWGTADDPYILYDAIDLNVFIQSLNEGWENAADGYYKLYQDVSITAGINSLAHKIPEGLSETEAKRFTFCGTFDGNGKTILFDGGSLENNFLESNYGTIKNLTISYYKNEDGHDVSFVGDNHGTMTDVSYTTIYNSQYNLYSFVGAPLCVNNYGTISAKNVLALSGLLSFSGEGARICVNNFGTIKNLVSDALFLRSGAGDYSISGIAVNNFGRIEKCLVSGAAFGDYAYESSQFSGIVYRNCAGASVSDCITAAAIYVFETAGGACYINEGKIENFYLCDRTVCDTFLFSYICLNTGYFAYYYSAYAFAIVENFAGVSVYNTAEGQITGCFAGGAQLGTLPDEIVNFHLNIDWHFYVIDLKKVGGVCLFAGGDSEISDCAVRNLYGLTGGGVVYEMYGNASAENCLTRCLSNEAFESEEEIFSEGEFVGAAFLMRENSQLKQITTSLNQWNSNDGSENNFRTSLKLAGLVFRAEDDAVIEDSYAEVWAVADEVAGLCYDFGGKSIIDCCSYVRPANFGMSALAYGCVYLREGSLVSLAGSSENAVDADGRKASFEINQLNAAELCAFVIYNYGTIESLLLNHESNAENTLSLFRGRWGENEVVPQVSAIVAAHNFGTVRDCVINVVYSGYGESQYAWLPQYGFLKSSEASGGIVGINYQNGVVKNCSVYGISVVSDKAAGGIAGRSLGGEITDCYADLCVAQAPQAGGVVGYALDTDILRCVAHNNSSWQGEEYEDLSLRYGDGYGNIAGAIEGGSVSDCAYRSDESGKSAVAARVFRAYSGNGGIDTKRYESDCFGSSGLLFCFEYRGLSVSENIKAVCAEVESRLLSQEKAFSKASDGLPFSSVSKENLKNSTKNTFLSYYVRQELCVRYGESGVEVLEFERLLDGIELYRETAGEAPDLDGGASAIWLDDMTKDELLRFLTISPQFNEWFTGLRSRAMELGNYWELAPAYNNLIGYGVVGNLKPWFREGLDFLLGKLASYDDSMGLKSQYMRAWINAQYGADSEMAGWFCELCASGVIPEDMSPCGIDYMPENTFISYFKHKAIRSLGVEYEQMSDEFLSFLYNRYENWDTAWTYKNYFLLSTYLDWAVKGIYGETSQEFAWWQSVKKLNTDNWIDVAGAKGVKYYLTTEACQKQLGSLSDGFKGWLVSALDSWDGSGLLSEFLSDSAAGTGYFSQYEEMRAAEGIYFSWLDKADKQTVLDYLKYMTSDSLLVASNRFYGHLDYGSASTNAMLVAAINQWDGSGLLSEHLRRLSREGVTFLYGYQWRTLSFRREFAMLYFARGPKI